MCSHNEVCRTNASSCCMLMHFAFRIPCQPRSLEELLEATIAWLFSSTYLTTGPMTVDAHMHGHVGSWYLRQP